MEKVRYGIIGCGRFAEKAIVGAIRASKNSELTAIQKRSRAAAVEKARELGVPFAFDSVDDLVHHSAVDAVFIVSANSAHHPETLAAAKAGKHVLVEKPMALNAHEGEEMINVSSAHQVKLMVGHMLRFSPLVDRIRTLVSQGEIGRVIVARSEFMYDARTSHRAWLLDRRIAGGGPTYDIGVHCLDTLRYVLDDEVTGVESQLEPMPTDQTTESIAHLQLRFSRGTIGAIFCSFVAPIRRTWIEIIGTDGVISASEFTVGERETPLSITRGWKGEPADVRVEKIRVPNLYIEEVTHFSDCILNDREPVLSGLNGLRNQWVLDRAMNQGGGV
jgi:1,5-anhydro-D-fructose reductase (1,5-anhydro-D-mannitol-forming)